MPDCGFINLNKDWGWTSHDCVAKIRGLLKTKKVGHGGTLDPAATGVLPIAVGKATRLLQFLPENKVYRATIRFGLVTDTDDLQGQILETKPTTELNLGQIEGILPEFIGKIAQIPPIYSAIQQEGKRLYDLARQGKTVEVPSRMVEVHAIKVLGWQVAEFPELALEIACGGGTYIRSIARDLGSKLGVGGTLAALERQESCGMVLGDSISIEALSRRIQADNLTLISVDQVLVHLPSVMLVATEAGRWCQGQSVTVSETANSTKEGAFIRVYRENGDFLGIGWSIEEAEMLKVRPKIVF
jgi:tRNA pseudouridine55 synthase